MLTGSGSPDCGSDAASLQPLLQRERKKEKPKVRPASKDLFKSIMF